MTLLSITNQFLPWFYLLIVVPIIIVVLSENRNPVKSLAWITVLLFLPAAGVVLYLFFGRSIRHKHLISRRKRDRLSGGHFAKVKVDTLPLTPDSRQLVELAQSVAGARLMEGNSVEIFTNGCDKFEALKRDIKAAKEFIHLQYYIIEDDRLGNEIGDLLIAKAGEGVKVRVLYDHVGSFSWRDRLFKRMKKGGVELYPFLKINFPWVAHRINWRNHRKVVVIDGNVGYIGGMNIADRYIDGTKQGVWRDTHLRIAGPAVDSLRLSFAVDWNFTHRELLDAKPGDKPPAATTESAGKMNAVDAVAAQLVTSGPTGLWRNLDIVFHKAIVTAKKCVYIQTPYFLPTETLLNALQTAALSRVDVRLMIPRRPDSEMLRFASYSYVKQCLEAGIKVYFYEPGMLHSKVIIIDDEIVTTGSTNFDFRSLEHNFEGNLLLFSTELNRKMKQIFIDDQSQSTKIIMHHWRHRPIVQKAFSSLLRLMSPIL